MKRAFLRLSSSDSKWLIKCWVNGAEKLSFVWQSEVKVGFCLSGCSTRAVPEPVAQCKQDSHSWAGLVLWQKLLCPLSQGLLTESVYDCRNEAFPQAFPRLEELSLKVTDGFSP